MVNIKRVERTINGELYLFDYPQNKKECKFNLSYQKGVNVDYIYSISVHSPNYKNSLRNLLDRYNLRHKASDKYIPPNTSPVL